MKNPIRLFGVLMFLVLVASPVLAVGEESSSKPLSIIEFSSLPENHGAHTRMIQRKYEEYRSGRLPQTTLDTSRLR